MCKLYITCELYISIYLGVTGASQGDVKGFMNIVQDSHINPVLCNCLFPAASIHHDYNQAYFITGSSGSGGGEFMMWDLLTGVKIGVWYGHSKPISAVAALSKEKDDYLLTGGEDGSILIWKYEGTEFSKIDVKLLLSAHTNIITGIAVYSPPNYYKNMPNEKELADNLFIR